MPTKLNVILSVLTLSACLSLHCAADELADKGREIFKKNQHAVVTVIVVQKTTYSQEGRTATPVEARQDLTGTVIDPTGLTVLSLWACDPSEMYKRMMAGRPGSPKVDTDITDVKILLSDGTEIPSEIVLRDRDLDLAFIRPKTKLTNSLSAVDLNKSGKAQVLDQVITLNRLNKAAGRAYSASVERITAVVQKPRTFYIPDSMMTATALGSPAFTLDGNILGLNVMRSVGGGDETMRNMREGVSAIFLPAEDILKAAKQAPEARGDTKPEESKDVDSTKGSAEKSDDKSEKK